VRCFAGSWTLGGELWKWDGTNVTLVADINETKEDIGFGTFEGNDSQSAWPAGHNSALYFSAFKTSFISPRPRPTPATKSSCMTEPKSPSAAAQPGARFYRIKQP